MARVSLNQHWKIKTFSTLLQKMQVERIFNFVVSKEMLLKLYIEGFAEKRFDNYF